MAADHDFGGVTKPPSRPLANVSPEKTVRFDTNLSVGPPLQHEVNLGHAVISNDGKLLVTCCSNGKAYVWDIHSVLKDADLKDLLNVSVNAI